MVSLTLKLAASQTSQVKDAYKICTAKPITYKVRNKMRKLFAIDTESALHFYSYFTYYQFSTVWIQARFLRLQGPQCSWWTGAFRPCCANTYNISLLVMATIHSSQLHWCCHLRNRGTVLSCYCHTFRRWWQTSWKKTIHVHPRKQLEAEIIKPMGISPHCTTCKVSTSETQ